MAKGFRLLRLQPDSDEPVFPNSCYLTSDL